MLVQDGDGRWYDDAGGTGSYHYETQDAASKAMGGGSGVGAGGNFLAGAFLAIFIFGPIIASKLVGLLWGLLLKLGIVGKVITSLLMIIAAPFILMLPALFFTMAGGRAGAIFGNNYIIGVTFAASVFIAPVWYYFWHYDVVKVMGAKVFSNFVMQFAKYGWFGCIGAMIISAFKGGVVGGFVAVGATIVGFVTYFMNTRPYVQEVERTASFKFRWVALLIAVGLTAVVSITVDTLMKMEKASIAAGISYEARSKKQKEVAAKFPAGTTVIIRDDSLRYEDGFGKLHTEPSRNLPSIRELKTGEKFTVTGEVRFDNRGLANASETWLQVNDNDTLGWVCVYDLDGAYWP